MKIYFQNFGLLYRKKIKKLFDVAIELSGINFKGFSVNLAVVNEEKITELNNKFREISKPTDVLSFPNLNLEKGKNFDAKELAKEICADDGLIPLGDIAICKNVAKAQAKSFSHSYKREVCFLALHGFLHLLGFDHMNAEDEEEMTDIQQKIMKKCGIKN